MTGQGPTVAHHEGQALAQDKATRNSRRSSPSAQDNSALSGSTTLGTTTTDPSERQADSVLDAPADELSRLSLASSSSSEGPSCNGSETPRYQPQPSGYGVSAYNAGPGTRPEPRRGLLTTGRDSAPPPAFIDFRRHSVAVPVPPPLPPRGNIISAHTQAHNHRPEHQYSTFYHSGPQASPVVTWREPHPLQIHASPGRQRHSTPQHWSNLESFCQDNSVLIGNSAFAMGSSTTQGTRAQTPLMEASQETFGAPFAPPTAAAAKPSPRRNSWQPVQQNILEGTADPFAQRWGVRACHVLPSSGSRPGGAVRNPILSAAINGNGNTGTSFVTQQPHSLHPPRLTLPVFAPAFSGGGDGSSSSQHYHHHHDPAPPAPAYTASGGTSSSLSTTVMMPAYPSIMSTGGGPSNGSSNNSNYRNDHVFHPMVSCAPNGCSPRQALDLMVKGFSPNYRGNPDLERNRSALIPEEENCSVFITGLSPDLTTHLLLASIRNMGRIYATHINGPEPSRGHQTCAAKVVFFERVAAKRFFDRYQSTGFVVAGRPFYVGHVVWNRIRSGEVDVGGRKSRVLIISGPRSLVNERSLFSYFASKIEFQVDEVITAAVSAAAAMGTEERALVEFRFGSYRCQAESARMALSREFKQHGVYCEFGPDPCDLLPRANPPTRRGANTFWRPPPPLQPQPPPQQ